MALLLTRAPGGMEPSAGEGASSGAILVTLVSTAQASAVAPTPATSPRIAAPERLPGGGASQIASAPPAVEGTGERDAPSREARAAEGGQALPTNSAAGSDYRARLLAHIQPFRRYPAQAEALDARGVTQLIFRVDQNGRVIGVWVKSSSGFSALDDEAMATVLRAQPMPHVPADLPSPLTVQLPVSFNPS